jgi:hypothetical protein
MIIGVRNYISKQASNVDVSKKCDFTIAFFQFRQKKTRK